MSGEKPPTAAGAANAQRNIRENLYRSKILGITVKFKDTRSDTLGTNIYFL
jgi:hypothetical protein